MASSAERLIWRLVRPAYAPGLDGEGARLAGGRWNSPGRPVVYAASHLSLAVLESFVHLPAAARTPAGLPWMRAICIAVPDDAAEEAPDEIDPGDLVSCRAFGDRWIEEARTLCLSAPSAVVPQERNILVNPRHPDMARLRLVSDEPFLFDRRLARPG